MCDIYFEKVSICFNIGFQKFQVKPVNKNTTSLSENEIFFVWEMIKLACIWKCLVSVCDGEMVNMYIINGLWYLNSYLS